MAFSSTIFLFIFLPLVYLLYRIVPGLRAKNLLLITTSLFFYAFGEPVAVLLLIASAFANYGFALLIDKTRHRKAVAAAAAVLNLALLGVFKYLDFLTGIINGALGLELPAAGIALPIGISFFTFQAMSYVLDVYYGSCKAQKNPLNILLYLSFFPQLIAGPIVKYHDIEAQISSRVCTPEEMAAGIRRFITGLSKKLLISNIMAQTADYVFGLPSEDLSAPAAWLGALSYMMQIYFDFSGYSDMAIGLGHMFGFTFPENFLHPYCADSMRDFWRRWHVSLSAWFRQYLYIPLGGNRKGRLRTCLNKLIVFFCTGLWHGANVTFVVWGMLHGGLLMLEQAIPALANGRHRVLRRIYTLLAVCCTFVVFRAETLSQAWKMLVGMFTGFTVNASQLSVAAQMLTPLWLVTFALAVLFCVPAQKLPLVKRLGNSAASEGLGYVVTLCLLALCILNLSAASYNPFIYFRF